MAGNGDGQCWVPADQRVVPTEDAARATFTGETAAKYGFTKVTFEETVGSPGEYTAAKVVFRK
ncbi:hypothetical protein [Streptomyces sp. NPDC002172]